MDDYKIITVGALRLFFSKLKSVFVLQQKGKELSDNNFTNEYKNICNNMLPLQDDGLITSVLKGPDGKVYKFALDDNFNLVLEEHVNTRKIDFILSGTDYYYINEDDNGNPYITKYNGSITEDKTVGYLRSVDNVGDKYQLDVMDGTLILNKHDIIGIDECEAKYVICNNSGNIYYLKILDGQPYFEKTITQSTKSIIK